MGGGVSGIDIFLLFLYNEIKINLYYKKEGNRYEIKKENK